MARRGHDVDALENFKVTIGFVQVADFDNRGSDCHVGQLFLIPPQSSAYFVAFCNGLRRYDPASRRDCLMLGREWQIIRSLRQPDNAPQSKRLRILG